ncbi:MULTISPECIES: transcriptional regulator [Brenneria]|uniref:Transcriptional regulator n=1 Tax=Brenneria nigrifluens DSM 30175 = ATCC 13028 TaxID=1121120 RepID=A0A2U1UWE9_9GAMM|nr:MULTISPECIES: transcriptional regulator [Brenneria]EHD22627.1 helix-turn-helix domain protein [Brenneria sp. EniD312]PWC26006.1 transcriptional regulator [Brenneria nigrifluens DSM 30175 = ATCC 13028]QCR05612.1 XRE family transcriptional regulator [Brenneria nigrifluens DSM 30175 = ATCC 13028]
MQKYIGERLREERERLGLSQPAMGEIGGVKKLTQLNYEKGERFPDASYLAALAKFGLDVQYVVTGVRASAALPDDELELINNYRAAPLAVKSAVLAALTAGSVPQGASQVFHGDINGQFAGNKIVNNGVISNKKNK